jgi:hypothetical protein
VARPAAVLAAKFVFVVGTALILVSRYRWWYFIESMAELLVWVVAGALLGAVLNATIVKFATKKSAVGVS